MGRLLKEDQENGTSPKKVIEQHLKEEEKINLICSLPDISKVILVMVLVFEEKEKAVKLLVNPKKQVEKAMQVGKIVSCCGIILVLATQEMAKHLKKDPASLLFRLEKEGRRLTGKEMVFLLLLLQSYYIYREGGDGRFGRSKDCHHKALLS